MIFEKFTKETSERTVKSLIGITKHQFSKLCSTFEEAYHEIQQERVMSGEIKRIQKGGNHGNLDSFNKKLFFVLYYLKTYCTFDVLGFHFGFSSGHAHQHVERFMPVLQRSLEKLNVLPKRAITTPKEVMELVEIYGKIVIDGVECACVRPQSQEKQKERYSGKKKRHTVKALVISDLQKRVLFICCIVAGSIHDYALMKHVFDPRLRWFDHIHVWLDLGFYGAIKDYGEKTRIHLPHKKRRKSKNNPNPELTAEQKRENKQQAATRIAVEHSIGGMKQFHCLMHRIRNHLDTFIDYFFYLSGGLWNLKISL